MPVRPPSFSASTGIAAARLETPERCRRARRRQRIRRRQTQPRADRAERRPAAESIPARARPAPSTPQYATSSPRSPPAPASTRLSVSSCRTRRPRPAPERRANRELAPPRRRRAPAAGSRRSRRQSAARSRRRQAARAARSARRRPDSPGTEPRRPPSPRLVSGNSRARRSPMACRSCVGLRDADVRPQSRDAPGSTALRDCAATSPSIGDRRGRDVGGASTHRSTSAGCTNASGITPMTVVGTPFRRTVRPTTSVGRCRDAAATTFRHDGDARPARRIGGFAVDAARQWRQPEHVEEARRRLERCRVAPARRRRADRRCPRDSRQRRRSSCCALVVEIVGGRERAAARRLVSMRDTADDGAEASG